MGIAEAIAIGGMAALGAGAAAASPRPKSSQTTTSTPWAPQGIRLNARYEMADAELANMYNRPWQGDLSVDMPQTTRDALSGSMAFANGAGGALANQAVGASGTMIGAASPFVQNAQAAAGQPGVNATSSNVLSQAANGQPLAQTNAVGQAGQAGATGAISTAQGLVQRAAGPNPAQGALAMGGQFANDPVIQQQIDNAALDVTRNFNEVTAPGLNAAASAGGNLNSARAGIAEAMARRDAGESVGRIAANLRGNAFNTGVGAAMEGNAQNNALALGANQQAGSIGANMAGLGENARQFDTGVRVDAANSLGALDMRGRELALGANAQLGEAAFRGFDAAQSAGALVDNNTGRIVNAGETLRAEQERVNAEDLANYRRDYDWRMGLIADNMGVITDGGSWGGSATGTMLGQRPNVLQGALGGVMMGAGVSPYFRTAPTVGGQPKNF